MNFANNHGWLQPGSGSHGITAVSSVFGKAVVHSSAEFWGRATEELEQVVLGEGCFGKSLCSGPLLSHRPRPRSQSEMGS